MDMHYVPNFGRFSKLGIYYVPNSGRYSKLGMQ